MKVIVSTTINAPTEAIRKFDSMPGWTLVVAGDKKTPANYALEHGVYLTPEMQEKYDGTLSDITGWNCIERRNFAFLWAHDMGADIVALVDDDNIPLPGWGEDLMIGRDVEVNFYETELAAFDPVGATNYRHLWHRGFPLQLLPKRDYRSMSRRKIVPDVQADFWNGDPDIDAVCRMEHAPECEFDPVSFPMGSNRPGPFNSQNTFIRGGLLRDYMMFPGVGRMDDIWASYYVQAKGAKVIYAKASVYQSRNAHNLVHDMQGEYLGYENNLELIERVGRDPESIAQYLPGRAVEAFRLYKLHFK